jgi:hypothetical protein
MLTPKFAKCLLTERSFLENHTYTTRHPRQSCLHSRNTLKVLTLRFSCANCSNPVTASQGFTVLKSLTLGAWLLPQQYEGIVNIAHIVPHTLQYLMIEDINRDLSRAQEYQLLKLMPNPMQLNDGALSQQTLHLAIYKLQPIRWPRPKDALWRIFQIGSQNCFSFDFLCQGDRERIERLECGKCLTSR